MHLHSRVLVALFALPVAALLATGCGTSNPGSSNVSSGSAFVVGTDAPMASVVSFAVQLESVDAIDANGKMVSLLSGKPTVDFAHYNGLQTLLDMNDLPEGTYSSVSITLGAGTIGYLNTQTGGAPVIATEPASFTQSTVTASLPSPLVVAHAAAPAGLRLDFDLGKSIQVDSSGQITGQVIPTFNVSAVGVNDAGGYIDEFVAAVVSVDSSSQSFVVQGPHGEQFTIDVSSMTEWDNNETLASLSASSIVQVSGKMDIADQTLDADEVAILSQNKFYATGQITYVQPPTGPATSFDLYVNGMLPTDTGLELGKIAQVNLTGSEKFFIYWMHNPLTQFLFNSSQLVAGQSVTIGGPASGAADAQAVTVDRVALRHCGFTGTVAANSINMGHNTFQMKIDGFAGVLVPQTVTVYIAGKTGFRHGFDDLGSVSTGVKVRVVGLLLKDPVSGQVVLLAHYVDDMNE